MERPRCETCPFFVPNPERDGDREAGVIYCGECRRYPPTLLTPDPFGHPDSLAGAYWPDVSTGDWCGEHPDFVQYLADRELAGGGETG